MTNDRLPRFAAAMLAVGCAALAGSSHAAVCRAVSGATTTPLVELYTSEGCDSCPPADRWLAANFARTGDAVRPLALAFHVDYWDRLGWADRFAQPAWTERQYTAMRANRAAFVYTPQVLLQGHEFTAWRRGNPVAAIGEIAHRPARAAIEISAKSEDNGVVAEATGQVSDPDARRNATLSIAYVDSGLVSDVKAGENRGVRLTHDHVVRALRSTSPSAAKEGLSLSANFSRPGEAGIAPTLVAFIQSSANGDVLQAVALALSDCLR
jgi:hypothetical protein